MGWEDYKRVKAHTHEEQGGRALSLLQRTSISIGRSQRKERDDRVFLVACEDCYAPEQYFKYLSLRRVIIITISTPLNSGCSAPKHVVERLMDAFTEVQRKQQVQNGDEFWVLIDTDHHIQDNHLKGTIQALNAANQAGFEIAISNPSFEIWLLLHYVEPSACNNVTNAKDVEKALKDLLGGYDKTSIQPGMFPLDKVPIAIQHARSLEENPDDPKGYWPEKIGTRVYRLFERILSE